MLKIGINGFGRIGRLVARIAMNHREVEIVGVNDLVPAPNLAYLFKYDSTHGMYPGTVEAKDNGLEINGQFIPCLAEKDPTQLPWGKLGADYVVESTGRFTTYEGAERRLNRRLMAPVKKTSEADGARLKILFLPQREPLKPLPLSYLILKAN